MIGYIAIELRRVFRDGGYLMLSLVLPILVYVILSKANNPGRDHVAVVGQLVAAAAFGALGVSVNNCTSIAEDHARGWLRQLRLTPLSPIQAVIGRGACALAVVILPILAVSLVGVVYGGVTMDAVQWLLTIVVLWVGIAPVALLGLALGYLVRPAVAQLVGTAAYLGLTLLGGLFVPLNDAPGWVETLGQASPTYRYSQAASSAGLGRLPSLTGVIILLVWTAFGAALAMHAYRRIGRTV